MTRLSFLALAGATALAACAPPRAATPGPTPMPAADSSITPGVARPLPAIPRVEGALQPRVVYPTANQLVSVRDSTFIFGSVGTGGATLTINGAPVEVKPNGAWLAWLPVPIATSRYELVAARGADTARLTHPIRVPAPATEAPAAPPAVAPSVDTSPPPPFQERWVTLGRASAAADSDRTIVGRPTPAGTYAWFFHPGTRVRLVGQQGAFAQVALDRDLSVWVDSGDVAALEGTAPPLDARRTASNGRVRIGQGWSDVSITTSARTPYLVEEHDDRLVLTLYNTVANTDQINYLAVNDPSVRSIDVEQVTSDRVRYTVHLHHRAFGYLTLYEGNETVLRVRHQPRVNASRPLEGITVVVDPGHPPGGATGPTGLWEPQAVLAAGLQLEQVLRARGANVVLTRRTMDDVALGERPVIGRRADGHAFVSLHLDAVPDGVNPFIRQGTGTYFFRVHSEPLARAVQRGMYRQMGIRDRGVYKANFAVIRTTWMPAILAEGGFLMIPEQEAFFRSEEGQRRYATGIADGLEAFFRGLAVDR